MPDKKYIVSLEVDNINYLKDLQKYITELKVELKKGNISVERANQLTADVKKIEKRYFELYRDFDNDRGNKSFIEARKKIETLKQASIRTGNLISDLDKLEYRIKHAQEPTSEAPNETTKLEKYGKHDYNS